MPIGNVSLGLHYKAAETRPVVIDVSIFEIDLVLAFALSILALPSDIKVLLVCLWEPSWSDL